MSKVPFKSQAISRDLAVRLKNRVAGVTILQDLDADRFPTLKCSIGASSVFIRISTDSQRTEDDGHVDALGLPQTVYSPHECEILQEDAATTAIDTATLELIANAIAECSKLGMKLTIRDGETVQAAADYAAADALATNTVAVIRSNDINPLTQQM